jgi:predicted  nucleic acid-binding Zn-ribbon protein
LRKNNIKSERELEAQNNELKILKDEKDAVENTALELMDIIDNFENETSALKKELDETIIQTEADIRSLEVKAIK